MIESGSTRKYILYAFGEIALVVIGILLALQINSLNEANKFAENEAFTLSEILANLQEDKGQLSGIIERRAKAESAVRNLLKSLREEPGPGKIDPKDLASFLTFERYYPLNNTFEMMKATGLKLSNKQLRSTLSRYYDFEQKKVSQSIHDVELVFQGIMLSNNAIRANIEQANTGTNEEPELFLKDPNDTVFREELKSELIPFQDNNSATLERVKIFHDLILEVIDLVNAELNTPRLKKHLSENE